MGCYSLVGKIVSQALGKCNGRGRWREERMDYAMAYPPGPPTDIHYMRPVARTVTLSNTNSANVIPPNPPPQEQEPQTQTPPPHHEPGHQPQPQPPEQPAPKQAAPPAAEPRQPKRGKKKHPGRVRFGPDPPPPQQQPEQRPQQDAPSPRSNNTTNAPGQGHGQGQAPASAPQGYFRYTPSPLPRWEATPRRHEYFSGEYRYSYPTPVREGIYSIATDANRLTNIFSEENPNACAIV